MLAVRRRRVVVVVGDGAAPGVRFGAGDAGDLRGLGVRLVVPFDGPPRARCLPAYRCRTPSARGCSTRPGTADGGSASVPADLTAVLAELTGPVAFSPWATVRPGGR